MVLLSLGSADFIHNLRQANFTEQQAETLAKDREQFSAQILQQVKNDGNDLATKAELKQEIALAKSELKQEILKLQIKLMGLMGAGFLTIIGILAKGFHWF